MKLVRCRCRPRIAGRNVPGRTTNKRVDGAGVTVEEVFWMKRIKEGRARAKEGRIGRD